MEITVKYASEPWEFEEIHKLNYQTFVEEIPQHSPNERNLLIDKYHDENTYIICLKEKKLAGMITLRSKRPFSLDKKLPNLDSFLPPAKAICEIRLLSVKKEYRRSRIIFHLISKVMEFCDENKFDLAIISGAMSQIKLYKNFGFIPFGPVVGKAEALYQPMYFTPEAFEKLKSRLPLNNL